MEKQEYLSLLTEQIRCKRARPMIADEIEKHIEDQTEAYEAGGLPHPKAVSESLRQMGDPIEAGVALDRIHRPKTEWSMILIVLALTVFGIIIQSILFKYSNNGGVNQDNLSLTIIYNLLGAGVMAVVYFMDYSILGKHPVASLFVYLSGSIMIIIYLVYSRPRPAVYYSLITLFIPFFAAIVYHFRNKGWKGFLGCISFFILYIWIAYRFRFGITALIETTVCALIIVTAVILKGGFGGRKAIKLSFLWAVPIILPGGILLDALLFNGKYGGRAMYQVDRIKACFSYLLPDIHGAYNFVGHINFPRALASQYTLLGNGSVPTDIGQAALYNDYVVVGMFSYFGILLSVTVIGILFLLFIKSFHISMQQRNLLGYLIGIGCSTSFLIKAVLYLASNFGYNLFVSPAMPFLSFGLCSTITNFAMMGLLLSIYRNTELISEEACRAKYKAKIFYKKTHTI